jgi:universal stress protein F
MYSNILVPVAFDHERDTDRAFEIARKLCAKGGKITAMHVIEQLPSYASEYLTSVQIQGARTDIDKALRAKVGNAPDVDLVVVEGRSGHTILAEAEKRGVDLIVIASHRPSVQDYFLGSTAARVVRHAKCPVHVIR